jgi:hypothetical protein
MAGLAPSNIRLQPPPQPEIDHSPVDIIITSSDGDDMPEFDDRGRIVKITHGDGSVTVSLDGRPLDDPQRKPTGWFDNLAEDIDASELSRICDDLLRGIKEDEDSRREWLDERAKGIILLGLKLEVPGQQGAADGAPVEGMSKVRHPLMQEAVLRFQANARSELLPTDGPVKIRNDDNNADSQEDALANDLEEDMNHYLTVTASEYYPDTDRMLLMLGFGGTSFKKVYFCPVRNRPVSETVDAEHLVVNNAATDLKNAIRITHKARLNKNAVRRLQILGVYRDVDLPAPPPPENNAVEQQKNSQQGVQQGGFGRPEDRSRDIFECYCYLDIKGYEHKWKGKESGFELPYRVTIDESSKQILSIVRNYDEDEEKELPEAKDVFVKYTYVPGFGFYDIGLLHILGNTTNALTAAWRELLDAGMYACFPGALIDKQASRQNSNILRIPPGGTSQIDTGGKPINQVVMPLPYKEPSQGLMALAQEMATTGMRIGGTAEQMVGEGKQDAQTGAVLAIIEQQQVVKDSVHKRMHAAQCEELKLIVEIFKEHPDAFWQQNKKPARQWDEKTFLDALKNYNLVPQADPNTASQTQRIFKYLGLKALSAQSPTMYNPLALDTAIISDVLKIANPQQYFAPPSAMGKPTPEQQKATSEAQAKLQDSQSRMQDAKSKMMMAQAKVDEVKAKAGEAGLAPMEPGKTPHEISIEAMKAEAQLMDAHTNAKKADMQKGDILLKDANSQEDRQSNEKLAAIDLAKDVMNKKVDMQIQQSEHQDAMQMDMHKHQTTLAAQQHQHETGLAAEHEKHQAAIEADMQANEMGLKSKEKQAKMAAKNRPTNRPKPKAKP